MTIPRRRWAVTGGVLVAALAFPAAVPGQPAPPAPPPATEIAPQPGMRIGTGQAPVVGGNAAGARERALDEAIRQAVELALGDLVEPAARAAQAKTWKAILAKARSFVPRYRTLEEGEASGVYTIRVEAEVDEVALRRRLEKASAPPGPGPQPPSVKGGGGALVIAAERGEGGAFVPALVSSLAHSGVTARAGDAGQPSDGPDAAAAAGRLGLRHAIVVEASSVEEGAVRGTGRHSIGCQATARITPAQAARSTVERSASTRVFVERLEGGKNACLARLATELTPRILSALDGPAPAAASGDLRSLSLEAEVVEPAVVPLLLKSVRSVGAVSSAEIREVRPGRVELRLMTRAAPATLAGTLSRDTSPMISFSDVQARSDGIRLRVRLRPPPATTPAAIP